MRERQADSVKAWWKSESVTKNILLVIVLAAEGVHACTCVSLEVRAVHSVRYSNTKKTLKIKTHKTLKNTLKSH